MSSKGKIIFIVIAIVIVIGIIVMATQSASLNLTNQNTTNNTTSQSTNEIPSLEERIYFAQQCELNNFIFDPLNTACLLDLEGTTIEDLELFESFCDFYGNNLGTKTERFLADTNEEVLRTTELCFLYDTLAEAEAAAEAEQQAVLEEVLEAELNALE